MTPSCVAEEEEFAFTPGRARGLLWYHLRLLLLATAFSALTKITLMTDGERIEQMIAEWGERNYPHGPSWYDRTKNEPLPALEIRMMPAFGAIEYNISNGGWAQFLWNCILDWRAIIADAKEGYLLTGAPEQSAALDILYALCERDEAECRKMHERANAAFEQEGSDAWSAVFGEFTSRSYLATGNHWEELFWDNALYEKREAWLAANEARVRAAYGFDLKPQASSPD